MPSDLRAGRGEAIDVLIVGGGRLLLLGVVERPTADVDVFGFSSGAGYSKADVLPGFLTTAVRECAKPPPLPRRRRRSRLCVIHRSAQPENCIWGALQATWVPPTALD